MIAFDIDGCVNNIKEDLIDIGKNFFEPYKAVFNEKGYYLKEIYAGAPEEKYKEFWDKFGYKIYTAPPKSGVYETIDFLKKNRILACYITTRNTERCFNNIFFNEITTKWLKQYDIELPIYYGRDKDTVADKIGVNLIVEDKPENIIRLQKVTNVLIYKHPYNENMAGNFVESWIDIKHIIADIYKP